MIDRHERCPLTALANVGRPEIMDHRQVEAFGEEACIADLGGEALPPLGSSVRVVPNHACNAVNLVDEFTVLSSGRLVGRWDVAARGMNA